ncbi:hypothetical protein ERJ75_000620100 [Trypanosoma vivax]|nr:hypothetical protein ERJ75_000620100 [Trypanosoma vivax]
MTRLALALACLLAGTLVSTRRGGAAPAEAGANIGAASILCEAAMQEATISEQAKALPCDAVKEKLEETLNSVPKEVWDKQLNRSEGLRNMKVQIVGDWAGDNTLARYCAGDAKERNTRVCSAKKALDTCAQKAKEQQEKANEAVDPEVVAREESWWKGNEDTTREAQHAKNLSLGATLVYLCTGQKGNNPCFRGGTEPVQLKGGITKAAQTGPKEVAKFWKGTKRALCTAKRTDRNVRTTIARFWAQVRDRSSSGDKGKQFGECVNYAGAGSDKGCLEYATQNTTEVFWMKTLLDADDALQTAEKALAAANRTLDAVTRLTERVHDRHELLVAALARENGAQARDAAEAPQSAGASAENDHKGDEQRDSRKAPRTDTKGEASDAETQSSTDSAHFGWLGVQLAAGMTTFAGRHANH